MRQLVGSNPRRTTRELARDLGAHYVTIARHLHNWRSAEVATQLLSCKRTDDSRLKSIITGDEKCCLYSIKTSRHWVDKGDQPEPQPKKGPHPSKIIPSV
ncbi:unnamed protein product [Heligmosomoides polygyrus]|uniref:HTH_48 domain-containing protein n=1 Tax=Heligmosomoides polygyrus TaxID=6339 RepID=A0A3P7XED1_HELPZ|nr:unnamed protein product [Heligmosomoides polygyrus]